MRPQLQLPRHGPSRVQAPAHELVLSRPPSQEQQQPQAARQEPRPAAAAALAAVVLVIHVQAGKALWLLLHRLRLAGCLGGRTPVAQTKQHQATKQVDAVDAVDAG